MDSGSAQQQLILALRRRRVMTLEEIQELLGGVSQATVFRRLRQIPYRTSYNCNGRYYTLHDEAKYDRLGLWSYRGIRVSREGSLTATVRRLVQESQAGLTQRELKSILGVRVQNVLAVLLGRSEVVRERVDRLFVYLHAAPDVRQQQWQRRREEIVARQEAETQEVALDVVIEILLVLIRHPGDDAAAVARRLRGRSPPVELRQIEWVFDRYQLGPKRGL